MISTLIPVGPSADPAWLAQAVRSTMDQDGSGQILVYLDGYDILDGDPIWTMLRSYPVETYSDPINRGVAHALNSLIPHVRGDYCARMDSDDWSLPGRYGTQLRAILDEGWDVCGGGMLLDEPRERNRIGPPAAGSLVPVYHPTMFCRTEVYRTVRYPLTYEHAEDVAFHREAMHRRFRYGNVPEPLVVYRRHPGQESCLHKDKQAEAAKRAVREIRI